MIALSPWSKVDPRSSRIAGSSSALRTAGGRSCSSIALPRAMTTALSMLFCSSRTFPGQE